MNGQECQVRSQCKLTIKQTGHKVELCSNVVDGHEYYKTFRLNEADPSTYDLRMFCICIKKTGSQQLPVQDPFRNTGF
jgi:hypothetical protein